MSVAASIYLPLRKFLNWGAFTLELHDRNVLGVHDVSQRPEHLFNASIYLWHTRVPGKQLSLIELVIWNLSYYWS